MSATNTTTPNGTGLGISTLMMLLLFSTNTLLLLLFSWIKSSNGNNKKSSDENNTNSHDSDVVISSSNASHAKKELSQPFSGTVDCFYNLTMELTRTGCILLLTYLCERHWFYEHSGKHYDRDLFLFVIILFFLYGLYTIKPIHDLSLLGREQTEEWKGWMQFIFLLYHYFHAEEVYNSVRVMITCYVWMTGFGNFSFFYIKQDYGWLRVVQMLWRLNFSVFLLMWTHGNTWILYYICPMHTFYFMMVYFTMYLWSSVNHTKWGIRIKLVVLGVLIFIIWDVNQGIFDKVFAFLGTTTVIGAGRGSVWEYYFRTSLDHWSSFLGMIFAVNYPLAEQYFTRAQGAPIYVAAVMMAAVTLWWYMSFYSLPKMEYNLSHAYTAIIPLLAYIFFRNMTPYIRSSVSMSLHDLGKTTLETYLLQHHIWLTSNAKTLLTIVPGHPWVNFALSTVLFFYASKELYRLTMSLRGMLLPDDHSKTFHNILIMSVILGSCYGYAYFLDYFQCSWLHVSLAILSLFLTALLLINRFARKTSDIPTYQFWSGRFTQIAAVSLVVLSFYAYMAPFGDAIGQSNAATAVLSPFGAPTSGGFKGQTAACQAAISQGHWTPVSCPEPPAAVINRAAFCETIQWSWGSLIPKSECPVGKLSTAKARSIFKNKRITFIGDSATSHAFLEFSRLLNPTARPNMVPPVPNRQYSTITIAQSNTNISLVWAPYMSNVTSHLRQLSLAGASAQVDLLVLGSSSLDAAIVKDLGAYRQELSSVQRILEDSSTKLSPIGSSIVVWLHNTYFVDSIVQATAGVNIPTESSVASYRAAVDSHSLAAVIAARGAILNSVSVSQERAETSTDGVHYGVEVYRVLAQMVANAFSLRFADHYAPVPFGTVKPQPPKPTGSMSFPIRGAYILALSLIMLVTMDSFMGIGYLSLLLFGRSLDWESAYGPWLKQAQKFSAANLAAAGSQHSSSSNA